MNKKFFWTTILLVSLAAAACQFLQPAAETATEAPAPTEAEAGAAISADTIGSLSPAAVLQPVEDAAMCAWAADGEHFWVWGLTDVFLYDAVSFEPAASYEGDIEEAIYDLSPDGKTMAYSLDGMAISLFDIPGGSEILTITPDYPFSDAFFSPDGARLGVASLAAIEIVVYDVSSGEEINRLNGFETAAPVYSARFASDGETLVWIARATIQPMNIESGELMPSLSHEDFISAYAVSLDGSTAATTAAGTFEGELMPLVTLWDTETGEELAVQANPDYFSAAAWSPDSSILAAGTENNVLFYESPSGDVIGMQESGEISSLSFSPDGSSLLVCSMDGSAAVWQAK